MGKVICHVGWGGREHHGRQARVAARYLLLGGEAGPAVVLLEDLAESAVAHDHPVVQEEQLCVDLRSGRRRRRIWCTSQVHQSGAAGVARDGGSDGNRYSVDLHSEIHSLV